MHFAIRELPSYQQKSSVKADAVFSSSQYAIDEISAYVAARDSLVLEAEQHPTQAAIKRARLANDFVVNCLKPARQPYTAQYLPEADAMRELQRCGDVAARIGALSAH